MRQAFGTALALATIFGAGGCVAGNVSYVADVGQGAPTATYAVPPEAPCGWVRVAAIGVVELRHRAAEEPPVRAMHLRMAVENGGGPSWTLDTRDQIAMLLDREQSRPAFATSSAGAPPVVTVPPGRAAILDLYYPLPRGMPGSEVRAVELLWRLRVSARVVAARTSFDRVPREIAPAPVAGWNYGWGWAPGWYDPFWPESTFQGAVRPPAAPEP